MIWVTRRSCVSARRAILSICSDRRRSSRLDARERFTPIRIVVPRKPSAKAVMSTRSTTSEKSPVWFAIVNRKAVISAMPPNTAIIE